jgi:small-conductance mechanosensitive channel
LAAKNKEATIMLQRSIPTEPWDTVLALAAPASWFKPLYGEVSVLQLIEAGLILLAFLMLDRLVVSWLTKIGSRETRSDQSRLHDLAMALAPPIRFGLWAGGCFLALVPVLAAFPDSDLRTARLYARHVLGAVLFATLLWAFVRLAGVLHPRFQSRRMNNRWDDVIVPIAFRAVQVLAPLLAMILAAPLLDLPLAYDAILHKILTLIIIAAVAWALIQGVLIAERAIIERFAKENPVEVRTRSISTQVSILKRVMIALISIFAVGCVLMTFDDVRRLGSSLLASAGLAGVVLGFAAQRVLGNLFAGIQIAFTQPIRLGDAVVVEGEWGNVEEITLTYVVVRVWDLRRLVLPISYFIEKSFQNWTRTSPSVVGAVLLYVDYSCPIPELRAEAQRLIEQSSHWDRGSWKLQITDATEKSVQVRVVATAADAGRAWDLRCQLREGLICWLQARQPSSVPRLRAEISHSVGQRAAPHLDSLENNGSAKEVLSSQSGN